MEYAVGMKLTWVSEYSYEPPQTVEVVALRSRGQARLSNGWTVDADGFAEGTKRVRGGRVVERAEHAAD